MMNVILILLMVVVFYFFMMRPQQKKQKELKAFRENLAPGNKIVTIGGIHGKILSVDESTILISTESGKLRMDKTAVSSAPEDSLEKK
jgi:preprotein translocase subunit YajC